MTPFANLTSTDFRKALTPETLRTGMIIQGALAAGASLFLATVVFVGLSPAQYEPHESTVSTLVPMSIAVIVFTIVAFTVGVVLYKSQFTDARLQNVWDNDLLGPDGNVLEATPAQKLVAHLRASLLIRSALLEAATFFGLATLMVAATDRLLFSVPWVWVNALPFVVLIGFIAQTFPTATRLERLFEDKFRRSA